MSNLQKNEGFLSTNSGTSKNAIVANQNHHSNIKTQNQNINSNIVSASSPLLSLSLVLGSFSQNSSSFSYSENLGLLAWIAGPHVVFLDAGTGKEVGFLRNGNNKVLACLRFGNCKNLLVTGEGQCRNGEMCVYEVEYKNCNEINKNENYEKHENAYGKDFGGCSICRGYSKENNKCVDKEVICKFVAGFKLHKYGIDFLRFFRSDSLIISIGSEDKTMNFINIEERAVIFSSKFTRPILAVEIKDEKLVLCGQEFVKLYNTEGIENGGKEMKKKEVDLSKLKEKIFISCAFFDKIDTVNPSNNEHKIFFLTFDCYLVELRLPSLILSRWVFLKANHGLSITIWNNFIGCACSDGIYRIFNAETLQHVKTLHRPSPFYSPLVKKTSNTSIYPDITYTLFLNYHHKLFLSLSTHTMLFIDIPFDFPNENNDKDNNRQNEIQSVNKQNSTMKLVFHAGSINNFDAAYEEKKKKILVASCSDDKTVILWEVGNILDDDIAKDMEINNNQQKNSETYIKHVFCLENYDGFKINDPLFVYNNGKRSNNKQETNDFNLTSIRFSPNYSFIVVGDSQGNLHVLSCSDYKKIKEIAALNGRVNDIAMVKDESTGKSYMATGGSDCFIQILDITNGFDKELELSQAVSEEMESPVIGLIFCTEKHRLDPGVSLKLVVAEQNSTITFFQFTKGTLIALQKNSREERKTYSLSLSSVSGRVLSGHDGSLSVWKTATCLAQKHFQVSKGERPLDNFRVACDNGGAVFAASNNDKAIRVRAMHDGKLICKIPVAESVSAIKFCAEDRVLIASSVEGYLYFFRVDQEKIKKMQKANELINSTEERNIIVNKIRLLQKFIENDVSLSKNEQVKYLIEKFQKSEETTIDDLKLLDSFVEEGKKKHQNMSHEDKDKKEESIELKEDKPNDIDDAENDNNNDENEGENKTNKDDNKFINLSKSKIFEKGLKERISNSELTSYVKKPINRISLTDAYQKKISQSKLIIPKIRIIGYGEKKNEKNEDKKEIKDFNENKQKKQETIEESIDENLKSLKVEKKDEINDNKNNNDLKEKENNEDLLKKEEKNTDKKDDNNDNEDLQNNEKNIDNLDNNEQNNTNGTVSNSSRNIAELNNIIKNTNNFINEMDDKIKFQGNILSKSQSKEKGIIHIEDINIIDKNDSNVINKKNNSPIGKGLKIKRKSPERIGNYLNISPRKNEKDNGNIGNESGRKMTQGSDKKNNFSPHTSKKPDPDPSKFSNININEELNFNDNNKNDKKIDESVVPEEVNSNISNHIPQPANLVSFSSNNFSGRIIVNTQTKPREDLSNVSSYMMTKTNFEVNTSESRTAGKNMKFENCIRCEGNNFELIGIPKKKDPLEIKKEKEMTISEYKSPKDKLMRDLKNFDLDEINDKGALEEIEEKLENLLDSVRLKLGKNCPDPTMEKVLEKYSVLLLDKIGKMKSN